MFYIKNLSYVFAEKNNVTDLIKTNEGRDRGINPLYSPSFREHPLQSAEG